MGKGTGLGLSVVSISEGKVLSKVQRYPGTESLLLMEDEPRVRRFTTLTLEAQGYKVYQAGNGREALRVLDDLRFSVQLVITDVVMPDMGASPPNQPATGYFFVFIYMWRISWYFSIPSPKKRGFQNFSSRSVRTRAES